MSVGTARVELGNEEQSRPALPGKGAHPSYARSREGGDSLVTTMPAFCSAKEAAEMVRAGLDYLAAADAARLAAAEQAECLQMIEQADAISTAVRAAFLFAFTAGQGYSADADYS